MAQYFFFFARPSRPKPAQPSRRAAEPPSSPQPPTGGPHLSGSSPTSGRPPLAARAASFLPSNPPQSDPNSSGFLRGFVPLVLLYLFPQVSEQIVEDLIRIEFVLILSLKPSLDFSRVDSSRLESNLFNLMLYKASPRRPLPFAPSLVLSRAP